MNGIRNGTVTNSLYSIMQSKTTQQDFAVPKAPVTSPHFDQEATLLSARPVVPIDELSNKPHISRRWLVGFGLAGMLLIGVSATVLYYSRFGRSESQPIHNSETLSSGIEGFASNSVDEPPKARLETVQPPSLPRDPERSATAKPDKVTNSANPGTKASRRRSAEMVVDESADSEDDTREERRAARREAKEQKRADRRWRTGRRSDGVLRIRDIFEGPPRP